MPGLSIERIDSQTGIVREGRHAGTSSRGDRLLARVFPKARSRFLRLVEPKLAHRDRLDAKGMRRSRISRCGLCVAITSRSVIFRCSCDDEGDAHITASFFLQIDELHKPLFREGEQLEQLFFRERDFFRGALDLSTRWPAPVMTKLASVSAPESSA